MAYAAADPKTQATSAALAVLLSLGIGYALVTGLASEFLRHPVDSLATFTVAPLPPPPPPVEIKPEVRRRDESEATASAANIRSRATQVVAPEPIVVVPLPPPPVIAAPKAADAADPSSGATDRFGPGTGAGGQGDGFGSGRGGRGSGGQPPRYRSGSMHNRDYPAEAAEAGVSGKVEVRYLVGVDGRVGECEIEQSSGSAILDDATCQMIRKRFRFYPSRDDSGRPVPAWIIESHDWVLERVPAEER